MKLKKAIANVMLMTVFFSAFNIKISFAEDIKLTADSNVMYVDEEKFSLDAAPYIDNGSMLVPLRVIENMGNYSLNWNNETKTASITAPDGKAVAFTADSGTVKINNVDSVMENGAKAVIKDGRMYIPLRAFGEAVGFNFNWDPDTKQAIFKKKITEKSGNTINCPLDVGYLKFDVSTGTVTQFHCDDEVIEDAVRVDVPEKINGMTVTAVGDDAFSQICAENLEVVTLPDTITSIGKSAFENCKNLKAINIPQGITVIEDSTFFGCDNLKSITIPNGVTKIGDWAFTMCFSLKNIVIPDSVTSIGMGAFESCYSLKSVTIPKNVTNIEVDAFTDCTSLTNAVIENGVTIIGEDMFADCTSLESVTIPSSVTTIEASAFLRCESLKSVTIPGSVTSIGDSAFEYDCLLYVKAGSYAETYAKENDLEYDYY